VGGSGFPQQDARETEGAVRGMASCPGKLANVLIGLTLRQGRLIVSRATHRWAAPIHSWPAPAKLALAATFAERTAWRLSGIAGKCQAGRQRTGRFRPGLVQFGHRRITVPAGPLKPARDWPITLLGFAQAGPGHWKLSGPLSQRVGSSVAPSPDVEPT